MRIAVSGSPPCDLRLARAAVRRALAHADLPPRASLTLAFVPDGTMRTLNARHRGVDRVTDVLSFGQGLPEGVSGAAATAQLRRDVDGTLDLGDIVVSPGLAARQARRRGWSLAEEVAFLAIHGALHLLGYRDETAAGYREMRRRGEEALSAAPTRGRHTNAR